MITTAIPSGTQNQDELFLMRSVFVSACVIGLCVVLGKNRLTATSALITFF